MDNDLSARIRAAIKRSGGTVEDFGKAAGISRATLFSLLSGSQPGLKVLLKLRAAGVTIPRDLLAA